jgi:hypothetical protein
MAFTAQTRPTRLFGLKGKPEPCSRTGLCTLFRRLATKTQRDDAFISATHLEVCGGRVAVFGNGLRVYDAASLASAPLAPIVASLNTFDFKEEWHGAVDHEDNCVVTTSCVFWGILGILGYFGVFWGILHRGGLSEGACPRAAPSRPLGRPACGPSRFAVRLTVRPQQWLCESV